jgi:hypothetical protein
MVVDDGDVLKDLAFLEGDEDASALCAPKIDSA